MIDRDKHVDDNCLARGGCSDDRCHVLSILPLQHHYGHLWMQAKGRECENLYGEKLPIYRLAALYMHISEAFTLNLTHATECFASLRSIHLEQVYEPSASLCRDIELASLYDSACWGIVINSFETEQGFPYVHARMRGDSLANLHILYICHVFLCVLD